MDGYTTLLVTIAIIAVLACILSLFNTFSQRIPQHAHPTLEKTLREFIASHNELVASFQELDRDLQIAEKHIVQLERMVKGNNTQKIRDTTRHLRNV